MKLKIQNDLLLQSILKTFLHYHPDTGVFTRVISRSSNANAGEAAGSLHKATGYIHISINGKKYPAHRLAWLYVNGEWPDASIDHINRNKSDNRIANLRVATSAENQQNRQKNKNNTSGIQGVYWDKRTSKWQAQIMLARKCIYIGRFKSIGAAVAARNAAKAKFHTFQPEVAQ